MCEAKIIGTGMIAKAMDIPFDVIIFASGVSDSQCVSDALFKREIDEGIKNEIVSRISNLEANVSSLQRNM